MSQSVAIISAATALMALVLAIFGASWLNQRNIERLLEQMEKRFDARFDTVLSEIRRLDQRVDNLDQRLSQRIDLLDQGLNQRIDGLDQRTDRIERQLDSLFKPALPPRA